MKKASRTIKFISGITTALFLTLAGCAIDNPIDYTTEGYVGVPNDNSNSDSGNDNVIAEIPECVISDFHWSNPPQASGYSAGGTINGINYSYNSSHSVQTHSAVYGHYIYPSSYAIPNQTSIKNIYTTSNTLSFEEPISNPLLVFSSIGNSFTYVPIEFSAPIEILWSQAVVQDSATKITGNEGFAIVRLNGTFTEISFDYLATESYATFAFGADFYTVCDGNGATGTVEWTRQLGTSFYEDARDIASDVNGNIYVTGKTWGSLTGNTSAGGIDGFVAKYSNSGVKQWIQHFGTLNNDYGEGVAVDPDGNVYVTGFTWGGLDGNANSGSEDIFLIKYSNSGVKQWTQQLGTSSSDAAYGIATDSSGNVYVTGYTMGSLDGSSAGSRDFFVVKYDSAGAKQWTKQLGTASSDGAYGIATDSSGNVYVTGNTEGALDGSNAGVYDLFVVKYDSGGAKQWTKQLGTAYNDFATGIATDSSGNVYVTGSTEGSLEGSNAGNDDLYVVKYDSAGAKQWTKQLGTSSTDIAYRIATDSSGNVYVTGSTEGSLEGSNAGSQDLFVVKYDSAGAKQWTQQLGTSSNDIGNGVVTDSNDNVYLAGLTEGDLAGNGNAGSEDIFIMKLK